jgi:hypothetical protein
MARGRGEGEGRASRLARACLLQNPSSAADKIGRVTESHQALAGVNRKSFKKDFQKFIFGHY